MLEIGSSIYNFFEQVLVGLTNITPDQIDKYLGFSKAKSEKNLEFFPHNWHYNSATNLPVMMLPVIQSPVFHEDSNK